MQRFCLVIAIMLLVSYTQQTFTLRSSGRKLVRHTTSLREASAQVGALIIQMTNAIQNEDGPKKVAELAAIKKMAEAQHTLLQQAYGAATG